MSSTRLSTAGCDPNDVPGLFALAEAKNLVLHTAFNRRHDPAINECLRAVRAREAGAVLGATLVSRDFPYPPAHYLATSGNLFKDCVVHDLDYFTVSREPSPASPPLPPLLAPPLSPRVSRPFPSHAH